MLSGCGPGKGAEEDFDASRLGGREAGYENEVRLLRKDHSQAKFEVHPMQCLRARSLAGDGPEELVLSLRGAAVRQREQAAGTG